MLRCETAGPTRCICEDVDMMSRPASVACRCLWRGCRGPTECAHSAQRGVAPGDTLCGDSRQNTPQAQHDTRRAHSGPGPADGRLRRSGTAGLGMGGIPAFPISAVVPVGPSRASHRPPPPQIQRNTFP